MGTTVDVARIFEQAHLTPDKSAVVYNGRAYSYASFARWIEGCRRYLAQQELPTDAVAIVGIERLLDGWILGFALRSLGLTTVFARDSKGIRRLDLRDVGCIVTTKAENPLAEAGQSANSEWRWIHVPAEIELTTAQIPIPDIPASKARTGGHILLTSGTTGTYKKVLWTATMAAAAIPVHAEINGITDQSVVYVANFGLWTAPGYRWPLSTWAKGGTVVLHQGPGLHQPLVDCALSHIVATPYMVAALMESAGATPRRNDSTRLTVVGGAMPTALLAAAKERLTSKVYTGLASTEGMTVSATRIDQPEDLQWHRIHPSRELQVVDEAGIVLGPGRVGSVRVRITDGLDGYLDDEAATREFFRDGYFYTGDLGLFGDDGRLMLYGRASDVIDILGDKIATAPLERALRDRLGVDDTCVVSIPDDAGNPQVHLVIQTSRRIERTDIEAVLRSDMRSLMGLPLHVSFAEKLPRNEMGKVQRQVLREQLIGVRNANTRAAPEDNLRR
jgi:acyl-coenzyme A synthetase/AMP-(fatty) acid ligase